MAVLRVKVLNEARHITYSAWCRRQMRVRICGHVRRPMLGGGMEVQVTHEYACHFATDKKACAFFLLVARRCP